MSKPLFVHFVQVVDLLAESAPQIIAGPPLTQDFGNEVMLRAYRAAHKAASSTEATRPSGLHVPGADLVRACHQIASTLPFTVLHEGSDLNMDDKASFAREHTRRPFGAAAFHFPVPDYSLSGNMALAHVCSSLRLCICEALATIPWKSKPRGDSSNVAVILSAFVQGDSMIMFSKIRIENCTPVLHCSKCLYSSRRASRTLKMNAFPCACKPAPSKGIVVQEAALARLHGHLASTF